MRSGKCHWDHSYTCGRLVNFRERDVYWVHYAKNVGESESDRQGGNEAAYSGAEARKVNKEDPDGAISDSDKHEDKINHIGISHARTRAP